MSPQPSLLQAEQPQLSQSFLMGEVVQPSDHFCGPALDSFQHVHVFPVLRSPELDAGLLVGSQQSTVAESPSLTCWSICLGILQFLIKNYEEGYMRASPFFSVLFDPFLFL